jgi:HrpA-like RNA helicase
MYTHERCAGLAPYQLPEMHRTPLHELCLQIKLLELGEIEDFLAKALEPPAADAVRAAVVTLAELQALDPQQSLTPLGHHLATLPCDVRIGKMLLFACMLRCLHPVLVIAAGLSVRSPWLTPFDKREASTQARRTFAATSRCSVPTRATAAPSAAAPARRSCTAPRTSSARRLSSRWSRWVAALLGLPPHALEEAATLCTAATHA